MKKIVSLLLVLCFCVGLAACGKSSAAPVSPAASAETPDSSSASPAASAAAPAETPAASPTAAAPSAEPEPEVPYLQPLVDELNAQEVEQRTEDDPSVAVFELGTEENTINYKFAMHIFQYVIMMAEAGDAENLNAYNRLLDSLPALEVSLENALQESVPELKVVVLLMTDEYSDEVAAVVQDGEIIYDLVNGVGTAPTGVTPILEAEELPPEIQEKLDEFKTALTDQ